MATMDVTRIANRALQRVGARLINTQSSNTVYSDGGNNATQFLAVYDMVRRAEQERNNWRFGIRRTVLRAIDTTTNFLFQPAAWAIGTTYGINQVVAFTDGLWYISKAGSNIGNSPNTSPDKWGDYFGPTIVQQFVTGLTPPTAYYAGELVYDISNNIYMSVLNGNTDTPPTANWVQISGATLGALNIIYPIGTGPSWQLETKNVFALPSRFLNVVPQDPAAGRASILGFPTNSRANDWTFENQYIVSMDSPLIVFRFAADITDPSQFNPLFYEALASRCALELAEPLTNSTAKLQAISSEYKQFMGDARVSNGIEIGSAAPPLDDWIATRI